MLGDNDTLIGRSAEADINLSDALVSHEHARIEHRPDGYHVVDLQSRNGTLLNDVLISERKLRKRDRIQIGETSLVFLQEGANESTLTVSVPRQLNGGTADAVQLRGPDLQRHITIGSDPLALEQENPVFTLVRRAVAFARLLRRNLWVVVPLPLIGLALGAYSVKVRPAPETVSAAVKLSQAQQPIPMGYQAPRQQSETFFNEPESNFASPKLVTATLEQLGVAPNPELTDTVTDGLKIERQLVGPTGVYVAQLALPPDWGGGFSSIDFLSNYLETYLASEVDNSIKVLKSQAEFMESELEKVNEELSQIDTEVSEFRRKHIDSLPEQASAVMLNKLDLTQRKADLELQVERHRIEAANVRAQMSKTDTVVSRRVENLKPLQDELAKMQRDLARHKADGLTDDHPDVSRLATRIAMLEREVEQKLSSGVTELERTVDPRQQELSRLLQQHTGELKVAESALAKVREQLAGAAGRAAAVPEVDVTIQQLSRRQKSLQSLRDQLFERHREKRVEIDLETANVRARYEIVSPAEIVASGSRKFLAKRLGMGLAGGLAIAMLIVALLEARRLLKQHPELLKS